MPEYISQGIQPEAVEPGEYEIVVKKAEEATSKAGNEMIVLDCEIIMPRDQRGPMVREYLVFTEKNFWKIDIVRAAFGYPIEPGKTVYVSPKDFIGMRARVYIGLTKQNGNEYNTIEKWYPASDGIPF